MASMGSARRAREPRCVRERPFRQLLLPAQRALLPRGKDPSVRPHDGKLPDHVPPSTPAIGGFHGWHEPCSTGGQ